ncbi:hypothetical protein [Oscillospiraceae bacterium]|nr:hypothetical protein [Oscillospiraceae bacterium]
MNRLAGLCQTKLALAATDGKTKSALDRHFQKEAPLPLQAAEQSRNFTKTRRKRPLHLQYSRAILRLKSQYRRFLLWQSY